MRSFHKMNPTANSFHPVMDFFFFFLFNQGCPFLPFRSYSTLPALCSNYICLLTVSGTSRPSPEPLNMLFFSYVPAEFFLPCALSLMIPSASARVTSSERLSLTALLKEAPHSLSHPPAVSYLPHPILSLGRKLIT